MVFSSLEFLFLYLPVTLILYYAVPHKYLKWRNFVLFAVSLVFYGWGEPIYVFLMVFTIAVNYFCGWLLDVCMKKGDRAGAKKWMIVSVVISLGILAFFKYYNFFVENLRLIPALASLPMIEVTLPIGISFYTFQSMSYTLDLYMDNAKVQTNFVSFGTYVTLFPQLIAGPIVRYQDVDDMLRERNENTALFASGVRTFMAGLGKKILFANTSGQIWETLRATPASEQTVLGAWLGIIFYTFQIYFDFSGYSDMAIGLGKMFGFTFLENFNYPYIAKSITDFWRRWHMSLSTWFREYVYFPLGGSRKGEFNTYRNLFIVWFLTGFWHGASWNYILWGLFYFIVLVIEKVFLAKVMEKWPAWLCHVYTLFVVVIGWLLFVSEDMSAGIVYLKAMFGGAGGGLISQSALYDLVRNLPFIVILGIASTPGPKKLFYRLYEKQKWWRYVTAGACALLLILCTGYLVDSSFNPFLYFRF
ncbi:MAG: MBOAT family O-acyltransferase [Eubacteriales bacterium]|jgi:alginate O-acetyltransferase complex protein AlgI